MDFGFKFRGIRYSFTISNKQVRVMTDHPVELEIFGRNVETKGEEVCFHA